MDFSRKGQHPVPALKHVSHHQAVVMQYVMHLQACYAALLSDSCFPPVEEKRTSKPLVYVSSGHVAPVPKMFAMLHQTTQFFEIIC